MSWTTAPLRRVADTTGSTEEASPSISYISDLQTTSKVLKMIKKENVANVDTTELEQVLTATTNKIKWYPDVLTSEEIHLVRHSFRRSDRA